MQKVIWIIIVEFIWRLQERERGRDLDGGTKFLCKIGA